MAKHRISEKRACPYYRYETAQQITCEGVIPGTLMHVGFCNRGEALDYKKRYCNTNYKDCNICRMNTMREANHKNVLDEQRKQVPQREGN